MTATREKPQGAVALLVSRRFGPLFATQFLSAFNDNALKNVLAGTWVEPDGEVSSVVRWIDIRSRSVSLVPPPSVP